MKFMLDSFIEIIKPHHIVKAGFIISKVTIFNGRPFCVQRVLLNSFLSEHLPCDNDCNHMHTYHSKLAIFMYYSVQIHISITTNP